MSFLQFLTFRSISISLPEGQPLGGSVRREALVFCLSGAVLEEDGPEH